MKGYIIDCRYVVSVKKLMENLNLPFARRKGFLRNDDEILKIILIGTEFDEVK